MSRVVRLKAPRKKEAFVHFSRAEMNLLLGLYSRRVRDGEWRDYAIDHGAGEAVFSVFRTAYERPEFSIVKRLAPGQGGEFVVRAGNRPLRRAARLDEALAVFERSLRLV